MKKLFILFAILSLVTACSSDDDETKMVFPNERYKPAYFHNFTDGENHVYLFENPDGRKFSCNMRCPNTKIEHGNELLRVGFTQDASGVIRFSIGCMVCQAQYNEDGSAKNDAAKGTRLKLYKFTYDKEQQAYVVW